MSIKTDSFRGRSVLDCCEIESVFESRDRSHSQLLIYTSIRYSDIQLYLHMFIALYVHYIQVLSTPTQLHTARTQCLDPWSSTAWSYLECWRGPHSSSQHRQLELLSCVPVSTSCRPAVDDGSESRIATPCNTPHTTPVAQKDEPEPSGPEARAQRPRSRVSSVGGVGVWLVRNVFIQTELALFAMPDCGW